MNILDVSCNLKLRAELEQPLRKDGIVEALRHIISEDLGVDFDLVVVKNIKYKETEV